MPATRRPARSLYPRRLVLGPGSSLGVDDDLVLIPDAAAAQERPVHPPADHHADDEGDREDDPRGLDALVLDRDVADRRVAHAATLLALVAHERRRCRAARRGLLGALDG